MANMHETFEEFTLKKTKSGWLVTVKGEHELKGDWHFKNHDAAVDFLNEGKISGGGGFQLSRWFWIIAVVGAILWVFYFGIPMALQG